MIGFPVPRQQFFDAVDLVFSDTAKDVAEVSLWVDGVEFAGFDQGIDGGSTLATSV